MYSKRSENSQLYFLDSDGCIIVLHFSSSEEDEAELFSKVNISAPPAPTLVLTFKDGVWVPIVTEGDLDSAFCVDLSFMVVKEGNTIK